VRAAVEVWMSFFLRVEQYGPFSHFQVHSLAVDRERRDLVRLFQRRFSANESRSVMKSRGARERVAP
jgi:hypothetical protein